MPNADKTPLADLPSGVKAKDLKYDYARKGLILVFLKGQDPTGGATHWDGTDFIVWGLNNPRGTSHAKFRQYIKITISKAIYDQFLKGTLARYGNGTVRYSGKMYNIPAGVFLDKKYWTSGNFVYVTNAKNVNQNLTASVTGGHTIFWKAH